MQAKVQCVYGIRISSGDFTIVSFVFIYQEYPKQCLMHIMIINVYLPSGQLSCPA